VKNRARLTGYRAKAERCMTTEDPEGNKGSRGWHDGEIEENYPSG
jgi:hypothetical protein